MKKRSVKKSEKITRFKLGYDAILFLIISFLLLIDIPIYNYSGNVFSNQGFIFGLIKGNVMASLLSIIALFVLFYLQKNIFQKTLFYIIAAGAITNIIERFIYGGVIDYIRVFSLPIFNVSDILIVLGIILFFCQPLAAYLAKNKKSRPKSGFNSSLKRILQLFSKYMILLRKVRFLGSDRNR